MSPKIFALKYLEEAHFPIVCKWWIEHKGIPLDPWQLSDLGVLMVNTENGEPLSACWVVHGNSKLGFIAHPVCNPKLGPKLKIIAMQSAIDWCILKAKEVGLKHLIAIVDKSALSRMFKVRNFIQHDPHDFLYYSFT